MSVAGNTSFEFRNVAVCQAATGPLKLCVQARQTEGIEVNIS